MIFEFSGKRIAGVLACVPANTRRFEEDATHYNFPLRKSMKLKELMGYDRHRVAPSGTCISDLAIAAFRELFASTDVRADEIDALVFVTQSPDHFIPQTSVIVQHAVGLREDILCLDLNQGCAGYLHGLFEAFLLLENPAFRKIAVVTGDVLSRKVNPRDRNSHPLIGDGAALSIVERSRDASPIFCLNKTFGEGAFAIRIPAGGFRMPASAETAREIEDPDGNIRSANDLVMQGASVFSFVQEKVPPAVTELLAHAGTRKEDVEFFAFHQPNRFMLEKLADALGVPREKMPNDIVTRYGNASSATIPTVLADNLRAPLSAGTHRTLLCGFGVGLTISAALLDLGPLDFCRLFEI